MDWPVQPQQGLAASLVRPLDNRR